MVSPIVLNSQPNEIDAPRDPATPLDGNVDPLSEVLALLKPQGYAAGGFHVADALSVQFPKHQGIKCYAMLAGECWLVVDTVAEPVLVRAGDCFLLPRGLPFRLTTDLALEPQHYSVLIGIHNQQPPPAKMAEGHRYLAGGHFMLSGAHAALLLEALPPIVHIQRDADKAAMRWSLERMREELRHPQLGGTLITQQLAYMMLVQALRLHLAHAACTGPGWLSALSDKHMAVAIACMHGEPGRDWTLDSLAERVGMSRSVFALRFRQIVDTTPMEYLTRWRMLLAAERLKNPSEGLSSIAGSLGYESESAFGKAFRRVMGCSPRQYSRTAAAAGACS